MQEEQRNLLLAGVLIVAVMMVWTLLTPSPEPAGELAAGDPSVVSAQFDENGIPLPSVSAGDVPAASIPTALTRGNALALSERIIIDTESVDGSIALQGARLDDLHLRRYRETIEDDSPEITLLSPSATPGHTYVELGWTAADPDLSATLPNSSTAWAPLDPSVVLTPQTPVTLIASNGAGLSFTRIISVDENYLFTVTDSVTNSTSSEVNLNPYGLVARESEPEGQRFWISYEGPFGYLDGSRRTAGYGHLRDNGSVSHTSTGGWVGITDKYWMTTIAPDQDQEIEAHFTFYERNGSEFFRSDYVMAAQSVPAGGSLELTTQVFAGAKVVSLIDGYRNDVGIARFDLAMDWGWFFFLTKPFFLAINWINGFVGNFGVAILIFTVLVKMVFFPLANKSYESMSKMRKVQPEMEKIRERYKDDRTQQQQEMMELYKREKLNPLAGCLPIVVQIPVFFSLYQVLFVTIEMRHAPFFGWIQDLSAPDPTTIFNLFGLLPWSSGDLATIPFVGSFLLLGVWPLVMGFSMWFQMQLNPPPPDPMQRRIFALMPFFFTFLLAKFAAGLVIYWAWNNTLSILQQWVIMKRMGVDVNPFENIKLPGFITERLPNRPPPPDDD